MTVRIGVLLSGTGRTLVNLLDWIRDGRLDAEIACVVSNREGVRGLDHARDAGIQASVETEPDRIYATLRAAGVDLVCLCGYLRLLPIAEDFRGRVINIHPALLPKFGGRGMFGHHVHEAVLAAGETGSGCTVHYCNDRYDEGDVLVQRRVKVESGDTADTLAARVFAAECEAYPEAIKRWADRAAQAD